MVPNRRLYHHVDNEFRRVLLRFKWLSEPVETSPWEKVTNTQNYVLVHKHKSLFATTLCK